MNKKVYIGIGLFILLVVVIVSKSLFFKTNKTISPLGQTGNTTQTPQFTFTWTEWKDPAGFAFSYPEDVKIDNHPDDETLYAFLTLTAPDKKGKIDITVADSLYADIKEWLAKDELVKSGRALETKIASVSGEKVALDKGHVVVSFIDADQVIYVIDAQTEGETYWQLVLTKIVDTFRLTPLEGESQADFNSWLGGFDTESVDAVEPVEVVE